MGDFDDGKEVELCEGCREAMQSHLIEGFFTDEQEGGKNCIICLLSEHRELGGC